MIVIEVDVYYCSTYEGDVVNGLRHGVGELHAVSLGLSYNGDWVSGKQHGKVSPFCVRSVYVDMCLMDRS